LCIKNCRKDKDELVNERDGGRRIKNKQLSRAL
jgi:hypothetical protein